MRTEIFSMTVLCTELLPSSEGEGGAAGLALPQAVSLSPVPLNGGWDKLWVSSPAKC